MDPDMNKYDLEHITTGHARMTTDQWQQVYRQAWSTYYTREHELTILRRTQALGVGEGAQFRAPLGVAVIGGVLTSTLLTLLVIPTVYEILDDTREHVLGFFGRRKRKSQPEPIGTDPLLAD